MSILKSKRKSTTITGVIAALLVIGTGVGFYLNAPSDMVALDINPSIEIHTNRLNRVVSVDPVNADAEQLMADYQLVNRNLESVIEDIVDRMIFNGYLISGEENEILITVEDTIDSKELLERVNTTMEVYLQEKQMKVELLQQSIEISDEDVKIAHDNNVSAGKMAIIDKLLESDNSITMEKLANTSIKELIQFSIEHNISLEDKTGNYFIASEKPLSVEDMDDVSEEQNLYKEDGKVEYEDDFDEDSLVEAEDDIEDNKENEEQIDALSSATVTKESGTLEEGKVVKVKSKYDADYIKKTYLEEDEYNERNEEELNYANTKEEDGEEDREDREDADDRDEDEDRNDVKDRDDEEDGEDAEDREDEEDRDDADDGEDAEDRGDEEDREDADDSEDREDADDSEYREDSDDRKEEDRDDTEDRDDGEDSDRDDYEDYEENE